MSITRHDQSSILSQAVVYGDTVYLAGVVAKDLEQDVKGQTKQGDLGHRHPQPRADERGLDRLGGQVQPAGARLRRGQARRPQGAGRDHGHRRQVEIGL